MTYIVNESCIKCVCAKCGGTDTYIHRKTGEWERWNKGVIRIHPETPNYSPFIFLTADTKDGPITGLHFNYYTDNRSTGGNLRQGAGPGGGPVLGIDDVFTILRQLVTEGLVTKKQVHDFVDGVNPPPALDTPAEPMVGQLKTEKNSPVPPHAMSVHQV